jgi:ketosteroid isomerase-like protein
MNQTTQAFFKQYEQAISESDVSAIASRYGDAFMFGGPQGVRAIKKDDFLKAVPRRREYFASVGLLESKVISIDETSLDPKYLLVKTVWSMTFAKPTASNKEIRTSATYILERIGDGLVIVFQIDHQDLTEKVKELGLA